jgi:hypothetical protein
MEHEEIGIRIKSVTEWWLRKNAQTNENTEIIKTSEIINPLKPKIKVGSIVKEKSKDKNMGVT